MSWAYDLASALYPAAKSVLFQLPAERAHDFALKSLAASARLCRPQVSSMAHPIELLGMGFSSRIGLAAGLDKNGIALPAWERLGFGFVEVGTVTALPQAGNPQPRLFRLKEEEALFNRMGFNNDGAAALGRRLEYWRQRRSISVPVGVNIGKSKATPNDAAAEDYCISFRETADYADYIAVNVSSPNTPGLRDLQTATTLRTIVGALARENQKRTTPRPLLVKLAPDLADEDAISCAEAAVDEGCEGLIVSNTTIDKTLVKDAPEGGGGLSGKPLFRRSTEQLRAVRSAIGSKTTIIGVGGVASASDAQEKLDAGADLVQLYSAFIYQGPKLVREIASTIDGVSPNKAGLAD